MSEGERRLNTAAGVGLVLQGMRETADLITRQYNLLFLHSVEGRGGEGRGVRVMCIVDETHYTSCSHPHTHVHFLFCVHLHTALASITQLLQPLATPTRGLPLPLTAALHGSKHWLQHLRAEDNARRLLDTELGRTDLLFAENAQLEGVGRGGR